MPTNFMDFNKCLGGGGLFQNIVVNLRMLSDLQMVFTVPRNSIQLLNINYTTKFQVEREPV